MDFIISIRWVVALKAEAISIIEQYKLVSYDNQGPFPIYKSKSQDIWLIVSGVGVHDPTLNAYQSYTYIVVAFVFNFSTCDLI